MRYDAVIIGGGLAGISAGCRLQEKGLHTAAVSLGVSLHEPDYELYRRLGGRLFMGDSVTGGKFVDGRLEEVYTVNFENVPLEADVFIISTGKFLAGGLCSDIDGISETTLGLDVNCVKERTGWYNPDFFARQPFLSFGVRVDGEGHPFKDGIAISNLFATGELVEGCDITSENALERIRLNALALADNL